MHLNFLTKLLPAVWYNAFNLYSSVYNLSFGKKADVYFIDSSAVDSYRWHCEATGPLGVILRLLACIVWPFIKFHFP